MGRARFRDDMEVLSVIAITIQAIGLGSVEVALLGEPVSFHLIQIEQVVGIIRIVCISCAR